MRSVNDKNSILQFLSQRKWIADMGNVLKNKKLNILLKTLFFMLLISILTLLFLSVFSTINAQTAPTPDTSLRIFEKVEIEASFPGGIPGWRSFLERNLIAMVPVDKGAPNGRYLVIVQFIVNREGGISDIKPLTMEGYGMEQEVVRIMKKSPSWTPAIMNGKPVNAYRKQPVTFMAAQEGFNIISKTPYTLVTNTDNELTIEVDDVKAENLEVTISEGNITNNGAGIFVARVTKPGRAVIAVFNKKKKNKEIGRTSFEVRDK
jgi:hypothetical protein